MHAANQELTSTDWAYQLKSQVPAEFRIPLVRPRSAGKLSNEEPGADWNTVEFDDADWEDHALTFITNDSKDPLWSEAFWTRVWEAAREALQARMDASPSFPSI